MVLGSGLGDFANQVVNAIEVNATDLPAYPTSSVQGHEGKLFFGKIRSDGRESLPLLIFKGRVHFYETGDLDTTTFPMQVAKGLGVQYLLATNAAGGINPEFVEGDLMLIEDFINLTFLDPIKHTQSASSSHFYRSSTNHLDRNLSLRITESATDLGINLRRGTYCWLKGPSYETKAEIEMLRRIGADAVGMSTVPELILGSQLGMRVAGISLISNLAAGLAKGRLAHEDVAETGARVKKTFTGLLKETILRIKN